VKKTRANKNQSLGPDSFRTDRSSQLNHEAISGVNARRGLFQRAPHVDTHDDPMLGRAIDYAQSIANMTETAGVVRCPANKNRRP
jgi:hypothetical protein